MARTGLIFIVFGLLYIVKPGIYRRWFWKTTDIFQQKLSPANYIKFMRGVGVVLLVLGVVFLILGKFKF